MLNIINGYAVWTSLVETIIPGCFEVFIVDSGSNHANVNLKVYKFVIDGNDKPSARRESVEDYLKRVELALSEAGTEHITISFVHNQIESTTSLTFTLWQPEDGDRKWHLVRKTDITPSVVPYQDLALLFTRLHKELHNSSELIKQLKYTIQEKDSDLAESTKDLRTLQKEKDNALNSSLLGLVLLFNSKKRRISQLEEELNSKNPLAKAAALLSSSRQSSVSAGKETHGISDCTRSLSVKSEVKPQLQRVDDIISKNKREIYKRIEPSGKKNANEHSVKKPRTSNIEIAVAAPEDRTTSSDADMRSPSTGFDKLTQSSQSSALYSQSISMSDPLSLLSQSHSVPTKGGKKPVRSLFDTSDSD